VKKLTSEQYIKDAESPYHLVIMASHRAAALSDGARPAISLPRNTKASIIALEEIAAGKIRIVEEGELDVLPE